MRRKSAAFLLSAAVLAALNVPLAAQDDDTLAEGFHNPPASSGPRAWWHWKNGNVTEEGIVKDLDWMERVGIGCMTNFGASRNTPQIVDRQIGEKQPGTMPVSFTAAPTYDPDGPLRPSGLMDPVVLRTTR